MVVFWAKNKLFEFIEYVAFALACLAKHIKLIFYLLKVISRKCNFDKALQYWYESNVSTFNKYF